VISSLHDALERSRELGFLGPGPVEDHITHARAFATASPAAPARAVDIGAGGGLPGLVLAMLTWDACRWTFLDAQRKRTAFLEEVVEDLGLGDRVEVVTERAEVLARSDEHRGTYDLVVARSFGPPPVTAECGSPLLRSGGLLVVSEPPTGSQDRWPTEGLAGLGLGAADFVVEPGPPPTHLAVMERSDTDIERYPRRVGIPAKRPIF
jgi:16S rRNA (guanine527-N7)-methyltransferase